MDPRIRFLIALTNLVKQGVIKNKGQAIAFAKRQFEKIDELFDRQIGNIFKKGTPSKSKIGEFFGFKNYPKTAQKKKGEVVPFKKDEGIKSTQEYKDIVEELRNSEIGNKYTGEELEKAALDMLKARNKLKGTLEAEQALKKRTEDIKKGDIEGTGVESLGTSMKKIKELVEELKKTSQDTTPGNIMNEILKGQKVMAEGYKKGNIRTAVRWFMRQEEEAGKLKLSKDDSAALKVYASVKEGDPIEIFRRYYGEDALEAVDEIGDVFRQGESFNHYAELLRKNVDSKILTPKTKGLGEYDPNVLTPQQEEKLRKQLLKEQEQKKMLEDWDPDREPNADGGIAGQLHLNRTGFKVGSGVKIYNLVTKYGPEFKKFAEALFIKASNMIRQGKGMWKGLSEKQRIVQHDNLVKKIKTFEEKGTLEDMDQYFGVDAEKAFIEARAKVQKQSTADEITKGIADVMQDTSEAGLARSIEVDNLKLEFPGISDEMIENILADTNPQRIAEVKATMKEALKMQEKGMGPDEIIQMFQKTPRTKQARGGLINILKL